MFASVPQEFTVDAKKAGIGDLDIDIRDPNNKQLRYWKTDFHDGTYKIRYIPEDVGEHKVTVRYDGTEVPGSPATVNAKATGDVTKCQIKGNSLFDCSALFCQNSSDLKIILFLMMT